MRKLLPVTLLQAALAQSPDWPQHLGPSRNGVYTGPWSESSSFSQIWKYELGEGFAAPVAADGRLLVYHRQGDQDKLESLDAATGKRQWSYAYATAYRDDFGFSEGPRATPAVDGERVFVYSAEGLLHAVNLKTGAKIWSLDGRKEFGVRKEFFGTGCSPLIDKGRLLMNPGGANGAGVVALDPATGKTLWKALAHESGYSSPAAADVGGQRYAVFFTREGVVAANAATGKIAIEKRWRARMAASVNAATPLISGTQAFFTSSYDTGAVLIDLATGKEVWSGDDSLSAHYATPVLKDGYLYGFHRRQEMGQSLRCVEWKSGKVRWSTEGFRAGTVTLAGAHLFVITEQGELQVAPASPSGYKPVKKVKVADALVRAYPAAAGGRLFVRSERAVAAFKID
jgi:outer membrane protein assembly factor BamB